MNEILSFLMTHASFLLDEEGFRMVDSKASKSFGGSGLLVLERPDLRLRFVRDRGKLFLDFQAEGEGGEYDWYSFDVVRQLVTGTIEDRAAIGPDDAVFLNGRLAEIRDAFAPQQWPSTRDALKKMEKARARRVFG